MTGVDPTPRDAIAATDESEELHRLRLSRDAALGAAQAAVRDATRLTRLLTILNDAGSIASLLDRALSTLSEIFAAEVVVLLDPAGTGSFVPLASLGLPEDLAELPFPDDADGNVPRTMREGGPLLVGDAGTDLDVEPQLRELGVESVLYLPVVASHAARGVLILARCRAEPFGFPDVGLLTAMAYRIGLAVEQAQRRSQLERIVHHEREIGLDLEEVGVARRAIATFPALVGADAATLVRLDGAGVPLFREDVGRQRLADDRLDALIRRLLDRAEIRRLEPVGLLRPSIAGDDGDDADPTPAGATLVLPFGHDRPDGLLFAFRSAPTPFDPDVLPIAALYAGQTAAALENTRLYRAVHSELADRQKAEQALKASEERLGALIRSVHDLIVVIGATGDVHFANPAAARVWSRAGRETDAIEFWRRIRAEDRDGLADLIEAFAAHPGETRTTSVAVLQDEGRWHDHDVTLTNLLHDPAVAGIVATFHDVTERRIHERQLEDLAFRDPLTGLANRARFHERLRVALAASDAADRVAVIFFDLDDFKVVNDSLGHEAGDLILKTVAGRMRREIGDHGLGARLGGDEFTVLIEHGATVEAAREVAERLLDAIRAPVSIGERDVVVGGSFGIALGVPGTDGADELLRKADVAMYRAKASGRNTCAVFDAGAAAAVRRMETETGRRAAPAGDEFEVFFQPIVSLADRRPRAAEALVHRHHPERGIVPPDDFVPIAEATGLVGELGRRAMERALRWVRTWRCAGVEVPIAIDLSARQLLDGDLVGRVGEDVGRFGIEPSAVTFEIAESTLIRGAEATAEVLRQLRRLGFRIAVDDLATDCSSLSHLKSLPLDVVKIDGSFVAALETDPRDRAIVRGIVALGDALGLEIVAEGVETEEQATILAELGCTTAQGPLFAQALPAHDFSALLPLFARTGEADRSPGRAPMRL